MMPRPSLLAPRAMARRLVPAFQHGLVEAPLPPIPLAAPRATVYARPLTFCALDGEPACEIHP